MKKSNECIITGKLPETQIVASLTTSYTSSSKWKFADNHKDVVFRTGFARHRYCCSVIYIWDTNTKGPTLIPFIEHENIIPFTIDMGTLQCVLFRRTRFGLWEKEKIISWRFITWTARRMCSCNVFAYIICDCYFISEGAALWNLIIHLLY